MRIGLSAGMSTPEIRGILLVLCPWSVVRCQLSKSVTTDHGQLTTDYPCFCLCLVLVQITRTIPLRRTILQFSQIRRTLALTFIASPAGKNRESSFIAERSHTLKFGTRF